MKNFSFEYINGLKDVLDAFPHEQFERLIDAMLDAYREDRSIFVMGNGGSASTASHWVCDVNKGCSVGEDKRLK